LEELELLNRLHAGIPIHASGEPPREPSPNTNPPVDPSLPHPDDDDDYIPRPEKDDPANAPDDDEDETPDEDEDEDDTRTRKTAHLIRITDSWVYPGNLQGRPAWVDPSWAAYAFYDDTTRLPSSPALRVPTPSGDKLARPGDYVVLQTTSHDIPPTVDVWVKTDFERLFPKPPAHSVAA